MNKMDYSKTLNLPKTDFPMRANLSKNEPKLLDNLHNVYAILRSLNKNKPKYILHDGPPYANGNIHIGHALNKILKDIIIKYKTLKGYDAPFIPGWDCHGLPVELKLLEELGTKKDQVDQLEFRRKAKDFALKFVDIQRKDFIRLGVWGDWQHPYLTLDPKYEARALEVFARLVELGFVYRGLRPVNWCIECTTALAEAEVEYNDKISDSIFVRFRLSGSVFEGISDDIDIVVWTTTPWTLISNVAIALHPELDYLLVKSSLGLLIFADSLADNLRNKFTGRDFTVIKRFKGKILQGKSAKHPFIERDSRIILADFVSQDEGSGCVHIAPGHGEEDFQAGKVNNLEIIMPLDDKGFFKDAGEFSGLSVKKINNILIDKMKARGTLLLSEKISHSYSHCWRCKNPLIFRTTHQWFLNIDFNGLRNKLINEIENVQWIPSQGKERMSSMVELRPDWCLSRQRLWGIPIPALKCKDCGDVFLDSKVIRNLANIVKAESSDIWFYIDLKQVLSGNVKCKCGSVNFDKEKDILDVWFESGVSYYSVVKDNALLRFPADLYLEGSDQHRGWFQVSLIPSVATEGKPPFTSVLTHGFVVDGEGRKMSKSLGNIISPQEVISSYGAEILRLWVSYSDYSEDIRLSPEILKQLIEAYRKIRNTIRFILGNLHDFDCKKELLNHEEFIELDKVLLSKLSCLSDEISDYYDKFLFYKVYQKIYEFCNITLSSFYLDILKDRLYTFSPKSKERLSSQTVLWYILDFLLKAIAPLLSFTSEEANSFFKKDTIESVFVSSWPNLSGFKDLKLEDSFSRIFDLRQEVLKIMEEKRTQGLIRSSLEAEVLIEVDVQQDFEFLQSHEDILREVFIVSSVNVKKASKFLIKIEKARGTKCPRCWNYRNDIGKSVDFKDVCSRCARALAAIGA